MTMRTGSVLLAAQAAMLAVALSGGRARAETYYLDASAGGPTFDGSQANPWRTVAQMQQFLHDLPDHGSGDTVLIAPGAYDRFVDGALSGYGFTPLEEAQLPRTDWLTLKASDLTDKPLLPYVQIYGARDAYLRLDGLHVRSTPPHGDYCIHIRNGVRHVRLLNLEADAVDDETQLPTGINVGYNDPTDILIQGCEIHHVDTAMTPGGVDITIRDNVLHHIAGSAVKSGGAVNMLVEDNHIHDQVQRIVRLNIYGPIAGTFAKYEAITQDVTGAKATVYVVRADSLEVTPTNKVTIQFQAGHAVRSDTGDGVIGPLTDVTVADRSHGSGLSVRTNGYTARRNHIHDYGSSGGIFVYPIGTPYSSMLFENNLVYNPISRAVVLNDIGNQFVFRNNTVLGGVDAYFFSGFDGSGLHLRNNLLHHLTVWDAGPLPNIQEGRNILQYINVRNPWSRDGQFPGGSSSVLLGYDAAGDAAFEALFADADAEDFRPAEGSMAVGFAEPAHAPATDLRDWPRDAAPDAGCYELGAAAPVLAWEVVAAHGPAGDVATAVADGYVEPRCGAFQSLRVTSPEAIDPATVAPGVVTITGASAGDVSALVSGVTLESGGCVLAVALSGPLPDGDQYLIALSDGLRTVAGTALPADTGLSLHVCEGDVDASGAVTPADVAAVRDAAGVPLSGQTARYDVDRSGGVTGVDVLSVHRHIADDAP